MKRYITIVFIWLLSTCSIWAQTNPYRIGSPHYWMAQGTLDIHAGKFDIAYEHLEKAQNGYRELGDVGFQIQATEALKTKKHKCMESLHTSARNIYHNYLNS